MVATPKDIWSGIDRSDRYMILSTALVPILFWWVYVGRKKYGTKGLR